MSLLTHIRSVLHKKTIPARRLYQSVSSGRQQYKTYQNIISAFPFQPKMQSGGVSPSPSLLEAGDIIVSTNGEIRTKSGDVILSNGTGKNGHISSTTSGSSFDNLNSTDSKAKICVFMGASPGKNPAHMEAARELARTMAKHDISLVYGGGTVGLMGEVARTLVSIKGPTAVHGIIPLPLVKYERSSESEDAKKNNGIEGIPKYDSYGRTTVVKDMHTRKQMMTSEVLSGGKGSGFIALSGGYGTMEELMEVITWNQLGIHNRGVVALNIDGFWDGILEWVRGSVAAGFISEGNGEIMKGVKTPEEAIKALKEYEPSKGRFQLEWGNVNQG